MLSPFQWQRESETILITLVHYTLVIYSRVAGKPHSRSVQYIPITEQMKTTWTANVYPWEEKTGIHPVYESENSPVEIKILTDVSISFHICTKHLTTLGLMRKANTWLTHKRNRKTQLSSKFETLLRPRLGIINMLRKLNFLLYFRRYCDLIIRSRSSEMVWKCKPQRRLTLCKAWRISLAHVFVESVKAIFISLRYMLN